MRGIIIALPLQIHEPPPPPPHLPLHGILFGCSGAFLFTIQDAAFKWLSDDYTVIQIIFLRSIFALILPFLWVRKIGGFSLSAIRRKETFFLSLLTNATAWVCFYTGLKTLPLTVALCVFFVTPVLIVLLSVAFLKEHATWRQWAALIFGFIGVFIITNPLAEEAPVDPTGVLWVLMSCLMWALTVVMTRYLESSVSIGASLFYHNLTFFVASLFAQPFVWQAPTVPHGIGMLLLGIISVAAQGCVFRAYRSARAATVAITEYSALIWAAIIGWLLWQEVITPRLLAGIICIVVAGLIPVNFRLRRQTLPSEWRE